MFAWLLKILCQTFIAFDQNKIIYDKKSIEIGRESQAFIQIIRFKINVSIIIKSFQTSCPINHFSFYTTNIYIVTNDNNTGVKNLTVWVKQNPKCTLNWINIYINATLGQSILNTKLQSFQYKLNLRILNTNSMLLKCGLSEIELCSYCFETKESLSIIL
jgi:hypothetical protein